MVCKSIYYSVSAILYNDLIHSKFRMCIASLPFCLVLISVIKCIHFWLLLLMQASSLLWLQMCNCFFTKPVLWSCLFHKYIYKFSFFTNARIITASVTNVSWASALLQNLSCGNICLENASLLWLHLLMQV